MLFSLRKRKVEKDFDIVSPLLQLKCEHIHLHPLYLDYFTLFKFGLV